MKKYKVLQVAGSPANPDVKISDLEEKINSETEGGWKVLSFAPSNISFKGSEINRLIIILEKDE